MTESEAPSKCTGNEEENEDEKDDKIEQKMEISEVKINIVDDENKQSDKGSSEMINPNEIIETEAIKNRELDKIQKVLIENQIKTTNDKKTITVYVEYPYPQQQYPQQQYPQQQYPQQQYPQQQYPQQQYPQYQEYPDGDQFEYTPDRNYFIRKVFTLVFLMLLFTAIMTIVVYIRRDLQKKMKSKAGMIATFICMGVLWAVNYSFCCLSCTRKAPWSYIIIIIGTLAYTYIVSSITSMYRPDVVMMAVASTTLTALICLGIAFTNFDFTKYLLVLIVASVAVAFALLGSALLSIATHTNLQTLKLVVLCISAMTSSAVLVIELQMILGGKSISIGEDDYAYAAYIVYTSLLDLFIKLLQIINKIMGLMN